MCVFWRNVILPTIRNTLCPTWNVLNSSRHFLKDSSESTSSGIHSLTCQKVTPSSFLLSAPTRLDPILGDHQASSTVGTLRSESESKKLGYFHRPMDQHSLWFSG